MTTVATYDEIVERVPHRRRIPGVLVVLCRLRLVPNG